MYCLLLELEAATNNQDFFLIASRVMYLYDIMAEICFITLTNEYI